jgi:hypothetical protein
LQIIQISDRCFYEKSEVFERTIIIAKRYITLSNVEMTRWLQFTHALSALFTRVDIDLFTRAFRESFIIEQRVNYLRTSFFSAFRLSYIHLIISLYYFSYFKRQLWLDRKRKRLSKKNVSETKFIKIRNANAAKRRLQNSSLRDHRNHHQKSFWMTSHYHLRRQLSSRIVLLARLNIRTVAQDNCRTNWKKCINDIKRREWQNWFNQNAMKSFVTSMIYVKVDS